MRSRSGSRTPSGIQDPSLRWGRALKSAASAGPSEDEAAGVSEESGAEFAQRIVKEATMATSTKATKPAVDHTAISAPEKAKEEPPKSDFLAAMQKTVGQAATPPPAQDPAPAAPVKASGALAAIETGRQLEPPRILLYAQDGMGKSSFAAQAPKPIVIQTEKGLEEIGCPRFPVAQSYEAFLANLTAIATEKHDFGTVAIDTLDWLERLIWDHVCRRTGKNNIEDVGGGFQKGYKFALDEWRQVISYLERCHARGMVIILLAHAKIKRFEDPENPAYDRYSPRLHEAADELVREWVSATLFVTKRLVVKKEGSGFQERAIAAPVGADGGERIMKTVGSPAWVAKNRYNMPSELPFPKDKGWDTFVNAMMKGWDSATPAA